MNEEVKQVFYSNRPRLIHMMLNIAFAPVLLYLLGLWAWPPALPHYIVFAITIMMALRYGRARWDAPRLVLDDDGLHSGAFYPADIIYRAEGSLRSVTLTILKDGKFERKTISLGWSSREDHRAIVQLLSTRFQREVPQ